MKPDIAPVWPAPGNVRSFFTTRRGGVSSGPYGSLNLAYHVGDDAGRVARNRLCLEAPSAPLWLEQRHSNLCVDADNPAGNPAADASLTRRPGRVLAIMTADCLPIFFASAAGDAVAIAHAGWRGLANGVIASTLRQLGRGPWLAWLGPAIGACHYLVGDDVRGQFPHDAGFERAGSQYRMDLYAIAGRQLRALGVRQVSGGGYCTYCDRRRFFSRRRDGVTGRMAGLIWFEQADDRNPPRR